MYWRVLEALKHSSNLVRYIDKTTVIAQAKGQKSFNCSRKEVIIGMFPCKLNSSILLLKFGTL